MKRYDPRSIEPKWQQNWADTKLYEVADDPSKPKSYVLDFFPYPSGATMHVGHVRNYTISDALSRYERLKGNNVLHPMGWDAFGLPAENYAIKTGISPREATDQNKASFKRQLSSMGMSYDWSREIDSTDPAYYRWTQWLFLLLFKRGLAYQKESEQWWCDTDQTVLANEQVEAGKCWRCGNQVTKKLLKQWFFKITDYADRLLADLDQLDWPEGIKLMQRNWIGRSTGARVKFKLYGHNQKLEVFTTRIDTIYGVTFMVLAPEHPLVASITTSENKERVESYLHATFAKSDVERMETKREKTGVFTGAYAINPATGDKIPVWIADYVLASYGTGAIMAVPAHDERDHEFAQKFDLPEVVVVEPETGVPQENPVFRRSIVAVLRNPKTGEVLTHNWGPADGGYLFVGGGLEEGEDIVACAQREIAEETGYKNVRLVAQTENLHHEYYASNKKVPRRILATGLLFDLIDETKTETKHDEYEQGRFETQWVEASKARELVKDQLHNYVLSKLMFGECWSGEGIMTASGKYDGQPSAEAREKMLSDFAKAGWASEQVNYKMRDWLISRQRYWGAPIPIVHCAKCGPVAVPEDQLPILLPEVSDYKPSGDGRSPLANVEPWVKTTCPKCGGPAERETDTMDGFACSSWYFLRFADPHNDKAAFDRDKADYWLPVDTYIGGAEHAVMHLLYARFWTKVMYDAGLVGFTEPFKALRNQGMILAPDGRKMSKSYNNVITPDEINAEGYGADALRIYELFIAPYDQTVPWSVQGIDGATRFLTRVWNLAQELIEAKPLSDAGGTVNGVAATRLQSALHKTIKKVTEDLESLGFNTAIASMMEFVNEAYKVKTELTVADNAEVWRPIVQAFLVLLAPYAPHITEELWHDLGESGSIHVAGWPTWDDQLTVDEVVTIAVQVNGKFRGRIAVAAGSPEAEVVKAIQAEPAIAKHLEGATVVKTIFVPDKIVNFVIK